MPRPNRALHRARQIIDKMNGKEWTKDVFKGSEFNAGDYCCITKNIALLLKNKEVVGKKEWVFRDWFPLPEFKVNSVYRHDGWE